MDRAAERQDEQWRERKRRRERRSADEDHEEGKCGLLVKAMYGTRDAAQDWEHEYIEFMVNAGFVKSRATPCMFYHRVETSG